MDSLKIILKITTNIPSHKPRESTYVSVKLDNQELLKNPS